MEQSSEVNKVLHVASETAARWGHDYVGTEMVLLAILDTGCFGKDVLDSRNQTRQIRCEIQKIVPRFKPREHANELLPQTPRTIKLFDYACQEAEACPYSPWVNTGHLLLGIYREMDGIAAQVLANLGIYEKEIRAEIARYLKLPKEPELSLEQRAVAFETAKHIMRVQELLGLAIRELTLRMSAHDQSKLRSPEAEVFAEATSKLSKLTYGSSEYDAARDELGPALQHHYERNRHHPEHFHSGVRDMTLIDLLEMFCDWVASGERHEDGNIERSIAVAKDRWHLPDMLVSILRNTAEVIK